MCELEDYEKEFYEEDATLQAVRDRLNHQTRIISGELNERQKSGRVDEAHSIMAHLYCESGLNFWARSIGRVAEWDSPVDSQQSSLELTEDATTLIAYYFSNGDTASALRLQEDLTDFSAHNGRSEQVIKNMRQMYEDLVSRVAQMDLNWQPLAYVTIVRRVAQRKFWCSNVVIPSELVHALENAYSNTPDHGSLIGLALITAIANDAVQLLEALLPSRLAHTARVNGARTALHVAAKHNSHKAARFLLANGCRSDVKDDAGATPLHLSCRHKWIQVALVLIQNGADVNALDGRRYTPLSLVLNWEQLIEPELRELQTQFVLCLLQAGAEPQSGQIPNALSTAIQYCSSHVVKLLGQWLKAAGRLGGHHAILRNPVHFAIQCLRLDSAKILVKLGVDVNTRDNEGKTTLHRAGRMQSPNTMDFIDLLLAHGAQINTQDYFGNTPLHCTILEGNVVVAKHLLSRGARIDITNSNNQTPYELATLSLDDASMNQLLGISNDT